MLTPIVPDALIALKIGIAEGEAWAVKLFFSYMYGMPKQKQELEISGDISAFDGFKRNSK